MEIGATRLVRAFPRLGGSAPARLAPDTACFSNAVNPLAGACVESASPSST